MVKHVVVISSLEKFVKERINFLQTYSGFLYYLASPRGLFNNESALAYILSDWFGCPEKVATIQSVLERYSDDSSPLQWFRELSTLKKEILTALQIEEWPKDPQSYYYADKALYDKAAQIAGREPLIA